MDKQAQTHPKPNATRFGCASRQRFAQKNNEHNEQAPDGYPRLARLVDRVLLLLQHDGRHLEQAADYTKNLVLVFRGARVRVVDARSRTAVDRRKKAWPAAAPSAGECQELASKASSSSPRSACLCLLALAHPSLEVPSPDKFAVRANGPGRLRLTKGAVGMLAPLCSKASFPHTPMRTPAWALAVGPGAPGGPPCLGSVDRGALERPMGRTGPGIAPSRSCCGPQAILRGGSVE